MSYQWLPFMLWPRSAVATLRFNGKASRSQAGSSRARLRLAASAVNSATMDTPITRNKTRNPPSFRQVCALANRPERRLGYGVKHGVRFRGVSIALNTKPVAGQPEAESEVQKESAAEKKNPLNIKGLNLFLGAQERTRTSTPLQALGPEPSASTNSATWAKKTRILMI